MIKKFTLRFGLLLMALSFASITYAQTIKDIQGDYFGKLTVTLADAPTTMDKVIVISSSSTEGAIKFELKDFIFPLGDEELNVGNIVIDEVKVTFDAAGKGTITEKTADIDLLGGAIKGKVTLNGTFNKGNADFNIKVNAAGHIPVTFTGAKVTPVAIIKEIVGDYTGDLVIAGNTVQDKAKIVIAAAEAPHMINFSMPEFHVGGTDLSGVINVNNVEVTESNGVATLKETTTEIDMMAFTVKIVLNGTIEKNKAKLNMIVDTGNGEMPVTFNGTKDGTDSNININKAETSIYVDYGILYIESDRRLTANIYNTLGQLVNQRVLTEGRNSLPLSRGLYIVSLSDGTSRKVIVK